MPVEFGLGVQCKFTVLESLARVPSEPLAPASKLTAFEEPPSSPDSSPTQPGASEAFKPFINGAPRFPRSLAN